MSPGCGGAVRAQATGRSRMLRDSWLCVPASRRVCLDLGLVARLALHRAGGAATLVPGGVQAFALGGPWPADSLHLSPASGITWSSSVGWTARVPENGRLYAA